MANVDSDGNMARLLLKLCTTLPVETRRVVMVILSPDASPAGVVTTVRYGLRINIKGYHSREHRCSAPIACVKYTACVGRLDS